MEVTDKLFDAVRESWDNQTDEDQIMIWNAYCNATHNNDLEIMANDPDDLFMGMTPSDIVDALESGNYSSSDAWVQNQGGDYWSFETASDAVCEIDEYDVIDWLIKNDHISESGCIHYEFI